MSSMPLVIGSIPIAVAIAFVLGWYRVTARIPARWTRSLAVDPRPRVTPAGIACDLVELVVVAVITAAVILVGGERILQPTRWAAPGDPAIQAVVAAAIGYLLGHLWVLLRLGGPRGLIVHHVVVVASFTFTLVAGSYHGYVLVTWVGTATALIRASRRPAELLGWPWPRRWMRALFIVFEGGSAIALPLQFFGWELPHGELPPVAVWVGVFAFPAVSGIAFATIVKTLRRPHDSLRRAAG